MFPKWTHLDLNPGPSACEADVIPLHHVPHAEKCAVNTYMRHAYLTLNINIGCTIQNDFQICVVSCVVVLPNTQQLDALPMTPSLMLHTKNLRAWWSLEVLQVKPRSCLAVKRAIFKHLAEACPPAFRNTRPGQSCRTSKDD